MAGSKRSATLADYRKVVKAYEKGTVNHVQIAEATGVDANIAWEIGAAIGARRNGDAQREAYRTKMSTYLERAGVPEDHRAPWEGYIFPEAEAPVQVPEYAGVTVKELRALAKDAGLKGYGKLSRDDLIIALDEANASAAVSEVGR